MHCAVPEETFVSVPIRGRWPTVRDYRKWWWTTCAVIQGFIFVVEKVRGLLLFLCSGSDISALFSQRLARTASKRMAEALIDRGHALEVSTRWYRLCGRVRRDVGY